VFPLRRMTFKRTWLSVLLVLCLLINVLQVKFLHGFYLIDRTALFLYPLLLLAFWQWHTDVNDGKARTLVPLLLSLLFAINTFAHLNLKKTLTWFFDAHTREILSHLEKQGKKENRVLPVGCSWPFEKTLVWYLEKGDYPHVQFR
jgi:hypothetical protein